MSMVYKTIVLIGFVVRCSVLIEGNEDGMVAKGKWVFINAEKCENDHLYPIKTTLTMNKWNRTHERFYLTLETDQDIDDRFAIRIESCKHMDGGCKPWQTLADASMPHFVGQFIDPLFRRAMALAKPAIESGYFPIPAGRYTVNGFEMDHCKDAPNKCVVGVFTAKIFAILDRVDQLCLKIKCEFAREEEPTCDED